MLFSQISSSHSTNIVGHTAWELSRVTQYFNLPYMGGRGLALQVLLHPMTQPTLNLWQALYVVILLW